MYQYLLGLLAFAVFAPIDSKATTCGPPSYACSQSTFDVLQNPATPPNVGNLVGQNKVVTDPSFKNQIVRITDSLLDSGVRYNSFVTDTAGHGMVNHFNTNSTIVYVEAVGGKGYPMLFNPTTMQVSRMYPNNATYIKTKGLVIQAVGANFSYTNPNWLYAWNGTQILRYDFSNYTPSGSPTVTKLIDFTLGDYTGKESIKCMPAGYTPAWIGHDGVSADDTTFSASFGAGAQDTAYDALVWKIGKGCRHYNTKTGEIEGDWGSTGVASIPDQFTIHNIFLSKDGKYVVMGIGTPLNSSAKSEQGPIFWENATSTVSDSCTSGGTTFACGGFFAVGYSDWINSNNNPAGQYNIRAFNNPYSPRGVVQEFPPGGAVHVNNHPGWCNADSGDTHYFFNSSDTPLHVSGFTSAWENEITGISPATGIAKRFAHNFLTRTNKIFSTNLGIGAPSQDGRFFMVSSDWLGTLGSNTGGSQCLWGYDWQAKTKYTQTQNISPQSKNKGGFVYSPSGTGVSGSAAPAWPQKIGATVFDGGITWTNVGSQNCRGDVFIIQLQ